MIYHIGKEALINIAIVGSYQTDGTDIIFTLNIMNASSGATILSKEYDKKIHELFSISDDIVQNVIQLSQTTLSQQENYIVTRNIANSVTAFEYFCLGYIENEKTRKQYEVIISLFRKAIREDPNFWEAYYNLGIIYYNDRKYDQALEQFDKIIQALPDFEKPYYGRGLIYLNKEEYKKAKQDFLKVIEFNPNDYKPYFYLGQISVSLNEYKEAEEYFNKVIEINPDYSESYYEIGNIYFDQKIYTKAIPYYKDALRLNPDNDNTRLKLGESYYRTQVYFSATDQFKRVLEKNPKDPIANFMLGITVYKQAVLNELVEAFLEMLETDLAQNESAENKQNKSNTPSSERDQLYKEMAHSFFKAQKYKNSFLEATFNLALTYHEMGNLDSAFYFYNKTLQIKPDLIRAHIKLANLYEERKEKQKALDIYKQVVIIRPEYFVAHPTLGPIHHYINIIDIVLEELSAKLKNNSNDLESNITLAKIYYAQGYYGKAANIFRKVLTINPNNDEARKMLAKLEKK
jgi:tetratricopeptide (TPR) repeat protein